MNRTSVTCLRKRKRNTNTHTRARKHITLTKLSHGTFHFTQRHLRTYICLRHANKKPRPCTHRERERARKYRNQDRRLCISLAHDIVKRKNIIRNKRRTNRESKKMKNQYTNAFGEREPRQRRQSEKAQCPPPSTKRANWVRTWVHKIGTTLVEPQQLLASQSENSTQHYLSDPVRVRLCVGQSQGGAPASPKNKPLFDAQMLSH